jgi:murein DD-endopeptidase MepM/ murein hydrolase activator NlpD
VPKRWPGALLVALIAAPAVAAGPAGPSAIVAPGGVVRWSGPDLVSCSLEQRTWAPLDGACWYAIDLARSGSLELVRRSRAGLAARRVRVGAYPYPTQRLEVEEKYVAPPPEERARIAREAGRVAALWPLETPRRFTLPLAAPLAPLPEPARFGARRVFNGQPRSPHSGADFAAAPGTLVRAVADGRVALAEEQYFAGRAVYVDHGDGLISMSFHLSEALVRPGEEVRRGQPIGRTGATGRVTGPHFHFGLRWHGARVDPALLLGAAAPVEIP